LWVDCARENVLKASEPQRIIMGIPRIKVLEHNLFFIETSSGLAIYSVVGTWLIEHEQADRVQCSKRRAENQAWRFRFGKK